MSRNGGVIWEPTAQLRWLEMPDGERKLQQVWIGHTFPVITREWRDVPREYFTWPEDPPT